MSIVRFSLTFTTFQNDAACPCSDGVEWHPQFMWMFMSLSSSLSNTFSISSSFLTATRCPRPHIITLKLSLFPQHMRALQPIHCSSFHPLLRIMMLLLARSGGGSHGLISVINHSLIHSMTSWDPLHGVQRLMHVMTLSTGTLSARGPLELCSKRELQLADNRFVHSWNELNAKPLFLFVAGSGLWCPVDQSLRRRMGSIC